MSVISVKIFNGFKNSFSYLKIPVINKTELRLRINAFVQSRKDAKLYVSERNINARREIFQSSSCELFILPREQVDGFKTYQISSGELCVLLGETSNCFSLCFIPKNTAKRVRCKNEKFSTKSYPEMASNAPKYVMSNRLCSFLVYEKGMIIKCNDGSFLLKGLSISLLAKQNVIRALFVQKRQKNLLSPEYALGQIPFTMDTNKFITITCFSTETNFSFHLKLSLLKESALQQAVNNACTERAQVLNQDPFSVQLEVQSSNLFPNKDDLCCTICLPSCMKMDFISGTLSNGEILCSHSVSEQNEDNGVFTVVVLSTSFKEGCETAENHYNRRNFPSSQTDDNKTSKRCLSIKHLCLFKHSNCKLVSLSEMEYFIKDFKIRLVSTEQEAFLGIFCSRKIEEASPSSTSSFRPYSQSAPPAPHPQSNASQTFTLMTHPQAVPSQCSMNLLPSFSRVQPHGKRRSTSSSVQTHGKKCAVFSYGSMNLPYASSTSQASILDPSPDPSQGPMGMSSAQSFFPASHPQSKALQASASWWNPQTNQSQGPMGMPFAQSFSTAPHTQSSDLQTSASWWDPQADQSQGPMGMPFAQSFPSTSHPQSSALQTSASWWDPQADQSQGPMGMPFAQSFPSTSHPQSSALQTSESWWDPQADPSQGPMEMPFAQSFPSTSHPQSSALQTSASWWNPQMEMPFAQSSDLQVSTLWWDPQADQSQRPMGMPSEKSFPPAPHPQSSALQTSSCMTVNPLSGPSDPKPSSSQDSASWWDSQAGSFQGTMEIPSTPSATSHTEKLTLQEKLELSGSELNKSKNFTFPDFFPLGQLQKILEEKNFD